MSKIPLKPKNDQTNPKTKKSPKYPLNNKNKKTKYPPNINNDEKAHETQKMTKIPPKPKNDKNTPKTQQKLSKIPPKPKKLPKYLRTLKNGQNNLEA